MKKEIYQRVVLELQGLIDNMESDDHNCQPYDAIAIKAVRALLRQAKWDSK